MSVLINMGMPTNCRECQMKMNCEDCEGFEFFCVPLNQQIGYWDNLFMDKRRDDCPLVPVPPHGRLIDADALMRYKEWVVDAWSPSMSSRTEAVNVCDIMNAPTIIEEELP